jgi:hypothetical protein
MGISTFSQQTVNTGLANPAGSGNAIINGAFDIWQRGNSFTNANSYTADRWNMASSASAGRVVTKEQLTKTEQELIGVKNFLRFNSTAAATYDNRIFQRVEGIELAGKTVTLSAWIRASSSGQSVSLQIRTSANSTNQNSGASSPSQTLTTGWQRYYFQYTVPPIPDFTIDANAFHLIVLQFSSNPLQVDVTAVQLEVGTVATPFKRNAPSIQAELAACQRYYVSINPSSRFPIGFGYVSSSTQVRIAVPVPVEMRSTPTITAEGYRVISNALSSTDPEFSAIDQDGSSVFFICTVTGFTSSHTAILNTLSNFEFSAEI